MIIKIIGLIIGIMICVAGIYYRVKEKEDAESRKIYGVAIMIGVVIALVCGVLLIV